jgi:hypothetical protein
MLILLLALAGIFIWNPGFWVFLTVLFLVDSYLYNKGHDTLFWKHKTDVEKKFQLSRLDTLNDKNSY